MTVMHIEFYLLYAVFMLGCVLTWEYVKMTFNLISIVSFTRKEDWGQEQCWLFLCTPRARDTGKVVSTATTRVQGTACMSLSHGYHWVLRNNSTSIPVVDVDGPWKVVLFGCTNSHIWGEKQLPLEKHMQPPPALPSPSVPKMPRLVISQSIELGKKFLSMRRWAENVKENYKAEKNQVLEKFIPLS